MCVVILFFTNIFIAQASYMQAENFDVNLHDKNLNSFKIQNFEL